MTKEELYKKFEPISINPHDTDNFKKYRDDNISLKFGDWFLYQINTSKGMKYPKLDIFLYYNTIDMAVEYNFYNYIKTWEKNKTYKEKEGDKYDRYIIDDKNTTDYHIEWDNKIYIFDIWKQKPNWKELKKSYEKTFWYKRIPIEDRLFKIKNL